MTIPFISCAHWSHRTGTIQQLVNLTTHIGARSVIWYQRWVDKRG